MYQRPVSILNQNGDTKPKSGPSSPHQSPKYGCKEHGCSMHLQNRATIQNTGVLKLKAT